MQLTHAQINKSNSMGFLLLTGISWSTAEFWGLNEWLHRREMMGCNNSHMSLPVLTNDGLAKPRLNFDHFTPRENIDMVIHVVW